MKRKLKKEEHYIIRIYNYFLEKKYSSDAAFMITILGFLFILSLILLFLIASGSFIFQLENAIQNIKIILILNYLVFILLSGTYVIHLYEKRSKTG